MTIEFDFDNEKPDAYAFKLVFNIIGHESSLSNVQSFDELPGSYWAASFRWTDRDGLPARILKAKALSLHGPKNTFKITPPDWDPMGTMSGNGVVDGAGQKGNQLHTRGWNANQPTLFYPGDYIEVNQELKTITEVISSDSGGAALLKFEPPIRKSPVDGQSVIVVKPCCYMRSVEVTSPEFGVSAPVVVSLTLKAREVL